MPFIWSFSTGGASILGRLNCWPIEPSSVRVEVDDGDPLHRKVLVDDGDGKLSGDGLGEIDYDYGFIAMDFSVPLPDAGTEIQVSYDPVEGGCSEDCGKCATHLVRLDITAGTISGSDAFTIADAWRRLFEKIERDILPIHVEIINDILSESYVLPIGYRFDIVPGDTEILDTSGLHLMWDDTSW